MKRLLLSAIAVFALSATIAPAALAQVRTQLVQINANGFAPRELVTPVGVRVTWINNDRVDRQVVSDTGVFRSPVLRPGQSFSFTFRVRGTYPYHDQLKTGQTGRVTVRATSTRAVTIALSRQAVNFGQVVELSGSVSSGRAGESVRIYVTPYRGVQTVRTVATDSDGTWSFRWTARIRTEFYAETGTTISQTAPILFVRPRLTLRVRNAAIGQFVATARAQVSFRGKTVFLQRRVGSRWRTIDRARLGSNSSVRFRASLPRGRSVLRLTIPPAPGYLRSWSSTVTVNR